jgi:phage gp37-like protein
MSTLLTARQAYMDALKKIPGVQVSVHGGEYELSQVKAYSKQAPAIVLSLLGVDSHGDQGDIRVTAHWGCIVLTINKPTNPRDQSVIRLTEAAVIAISRAWASGGAGSSRPIGMRAENMFTDAQDLEGIALWKIEWDQRLDLLERSDDGDVVPFEQLVADWDLYPRDNDAELGEVVDNHQVIPLAQSEDA